MATENLKDFTVEWILFGLLTFCLLAFATTFIFLNNPGALGPEGDKLDKFQENILGDIMPLENTSNSLLNISAQNDPEVSDLGSRDSVATSYSLTGSGAGFFQTFKLFLGWIVQGTAGEILIVVLVGMFGILSVYYITKWIRIGG